MSEYFDLGRYERSVSSQSKTAILWFNRGLKWCYGFNQEEAIRCFETALENDPNFPMAHWGIAYAAGPFYNKPWEWFGEEERLWAIPYCHYHAQQALELSTTATDLEKLLIRALVCKHPSPSAESIQEMDNWMQDYADAMLKVYEQFNQDLDVICLTAESLINLTPWKLWDIQRGVPAPDSAVVKAIDLIDQGLELCSEQKGPLHPGLAHFHIHVHEMSPKPETALKIANELRHLMPECGHLLHMPSHIDSLVGDWQSALEANDRAINTDLEYIALRGNKEFYLIAALHNYEFKMWSAMFLGQYAPAWKAAQTLCSLLSEDLFKGPSKYLSSTLEGSYPGFVHVLVRFGLWQTISDHKMPDKKELYPITTIMLVYAKAIAESALGNHGLAAEFQKEFKDLLANIPDWHLIHNNPTRNILQVANAMMDGEIEYHAGNHESGFTHLRRANEIYDNLVYCEPWAWMHPPRHALGALLLEQGQVEEAIIHYEDDLGIGNRLPRCVQHPHNIWAMHGYNECLEKLGRKNDVDAFKPKLAQAMALADKTVTSSCGCRFMKK